MLTLTVVILDLNTISGTKPRILMPKRYDDHPLTPHGSPPPIPTGQHLSFCFYDGCLRINFLVITAARQVRVCFFFRHFKKDAANAVFSVMFAHF